MTRRPGLPRNSGTLYSPGAHSAFKRVRLSGRTRQVLGMYQARRERSASRLERKVS